jgi:hypothetical protein
MTKRDHYIDVIIDTMKGNNKAATEYLAFLIVRDLIDAGYRIVSRETEPGAVAIGGAGGNGGGKGGSAVVFGDGVAIGGKGGNT